MSRESKNYSLQGANDTGTQHKLPQTCPTSGQPRSCTRLAGR